MVQRLSLLIMGDQSSANSLGAVPLFPLPNIVLFPHAVLPLHIFEDRYKKMMADVLEGSGQIAMALLQPGWEKSYYDRPALQPVVCVGTILSHEKLADGRYNLLLRGTVRAKILREIDESDHLYRVAELETLSEIEADESQLQTLRLRLAEMFTSGPIAKLGLASQFRKVLQSNLRTPMVADLVAFSFFEEPIVKQSLLSEPDVLARVVRIVKELQAIQDSIQPPPPPISPASLN